MNNDMVTDGEKLIKLMVTMKDFLAFQESIKEDKTLYDLTQIAIDKMYDCSIFLAEKIEKEMKEWSAKNGN